MKKLDWDRLPLEIIEHIFANLEHENLLSASGVSLFWYEAANGILARAGRSIFRRGAPMPKESVTSLCVVGGDGIEEVLERCKEVKELELRTDDVEIVSSSLISTSVRACNQLCLLCLTNYKIGTDQAKTILLESSFFQLQLKVKNKSDLSREGLELLTDNRELFPQLSIECIRQNAVTAWFPIPSNYQLSPVSSLKTTTIDCRTLTKLDLDDTNNTEFLILSNAIYLQKEHLLKMSKLKLKHLKLAQCQIDEDSLGQILLCFPCLNSLVLLDCSLKTQKLLKSLTKLKYLEIELSSKEILTLNDLFSAKDLISLKLISRIRLLESLCDGLQSHWVKLKKLSFVAIDISSSQEENQVKNTISNITMKRNIQFKFSIQTTKQNFFMINV